MPASNNGPQCLHRHPSLWGSRIVLCIVAFVATGAAVYRLGTKQVGQTDRYMATATIHHRLVPSDEAGRVGPNEPHRLNAAAVERQMLSTENLRRAIRKLGFRADDTARTDLAAGADQTIEQLRRNLHVTTAETSPPAQLQIRISCTDEDAGRVVQVVNTLAEGYAEEHRAKREADVRQDYLDAQAAAQAARQEFLEAEGRFDDFVQRHFLTQENLAERMAEAPPSPKPVAGPPSDGLVEPTPQMKHNSEKTELTGQLAELEQRRAQLLTDRTLAHPEVRHVDIRIAQLRERLASIPDQASDDHREASPAAEAPAPEPPAAQSLSGIPDGISPAEMVEQSAEAVEQFHALKEALDQARQEYDRLSEVKRRAWEAQHAIPNIELELAETSELCRPAEHSPQLLLTALAAALAVAAGVGLIKSGFDTDPPLTTREQAEAAVPVPIVGAIPATDSPSAGACQPRSRPTGGLTKIVYGVLLIAVCFGVLVIVC